MQSHNTYNHASHLRTPDDLPTSYDVVIVGGGPAGSTAATLLARWGKNVLLLEKEHFPRHHVGESLLAGTTHLMKKLGVYEKVAQAGFIHKFGATYIWGKSEEPWFISFSEVSNEERYSFQVEREKYDKILLDHSRETGAIVKEGCRVIDFLRNGETVIGVRYLDEEQNTHTVYCHYCIDASGQSALIGSALKLRRFNQTLRNFAIYGYFRGGKHAVEIIPELREQDKGNIFVVAIDKGWIWYIPLSDGRYSVGVVTHASLAKELNKEKRYAFYKECLDTTPQIKYLLSEAEIETTDLYTQSDWSYVCDSFKGPGYLLAGDAACFVDPILSTGVDLAMEGAFRAAIALNTALDHPELAEQALLWYEAEYKTKAGHFLQMAEHWYHGNRTRDDWFWQARRLVDPNSNLSIRQAFILLSGGFTNSAGEEDLPALQSFGGFRPFQLRTIYASLYNEIAEQDKTASSRVKNQSGSNDKLIRPAELPDSPLLFAEHMFYRTYMLEQDDHLVPIVQILQDIEGIVTVKLHLPIAALEILECIDGKKQAQTIAHQQATLSLKSETIYSIINNLYTLGIIEPAADQVVEPV